jgi:hypothetical protein
LINIFLTCLGAYCDFGLSLSQDQVGDHHQHVRSMMRINIRVTHRRIASGSRRSVAQKLGK